MTDFDLTNFKAKTVDEATHFEMGGKKGGKFKIPFDKKLDLYKFIVKNPKYCITERPQKIFPLYFDIDDLDEKESIDNLIKNKILPNVHKVLNLNQSKNKNIEMHSILQNKSKKNFYHIHFPYIIVNKLIAKKIGNLINKEEKILDLSVYTNGLRIFKTFKTGKSGNVKDTNYDFINDFDKNMKFERQIKLVSIHIKEDTELTPINDNFQLEFEEDKRKNSEKIIDNSKLSDLCNELTGLKAKWKFKKGSGKHVNSYMLQTIDTNACLSELLNNTTRVNHSTGGHSSLIVGKTIAKCKCFNEDDHGEFNFNKKPKYTQTLRKIKKELGLIKNEDDLNDFEILCDLMIKYAQKRNYKRSGGYIMKPKSDIPIVYERLCLYRDFLNEVFTSTKNDYYYRLYRKSPRNYNNLMTYLQSFDDKDFNYIEIDHHIFAFKNGYIDISNLNNIKFIPYKKMKEITPTTTVYHDYNFEISWLKMFDNDTIPNLPTPRFDKLLTYQFKNDEPEKFQEIYTIFLGMAGRLHYPLNQYDKFNCMLFIKGGSNTGKSTTGNILMNNHQNVGTISSKMEDTFGLESFIENKNKTIYCSDLPQNFHRKMDKGDLQKIISGESLSISRKGKVAVNNYPWTAPAFFIGNYFPAYNDSSGAIPRRLCIFFMNNPVKERDNTFEKDCITKESHFILLKSLYYYRKLIKKFDGKTFEDWGIQYFKKGFSELMTTCNHLYNFLTLAPGDFDYWPIYLKGAEMPLKGKHGFKSKYEKYLYFEKAKQRKWIKDPTTLGRCGFKLISKNICGNCGTICTIDRKETCCENFTENNIREKEYILNMKIIDQDSDCDFDNSDSE